MKNKKTAILIGGTFQPITNAHIQMGIEVRRYFNKDEADIIYIPSRLDFIKDWKQFPNNPIFGDEYRLELIRKSIDPYGFKLSTIEVDNVVNGTTFETISYFRKAYGRVLFCVGLDKLDQIVQWYNYDELCQIAELIVFNRGSKSDKYLSVMCKDCGIYVDLCISMETPALKHASSTRIREAFFNNDLSVVKGITPAPVYEFLERMTSMYNINYRKLKNDIVEWIRDWFERNGKGCNAVVGISGGKDSSVVAALCVEALGKDRVIGVLMPKGEQSDIDCSIQLVNHLGIKYINFNIGETVESIYKEWDKTCGEVQITQQTMTNLPARIRMATLYAISQSLNGRVSNNCNLSEDYVGYSTKYGDSVGDFSPISHITVTEVKGIAYELGLPKNLIEKTPSDGLCGKSDEDNLGFSYEVLDKFIRTGDCEDTNIQAKIIDLHNKNQFKLELMPSFEPNIYEYYYES